jgi:ABC-type transporter MlaC component
MFEGLYSCMENYAKYLKTYQDQNMKIVPIKPPETEKNNLIQVSFSQKRRIDPPPTA